MDDVPDFGDDDGGGRVDAVKVHVVLALVACVLTTLCVATTGTSS